MWGHLQAVELLVNSDADIEICDNDGKTAVSQLHVVVHSHAPNIMQLTTCTILNTVLKIQCNLINYKTLNSLDVIKVNLR